MAIDLGDVEAKNSLANYYRDINHKSKKVKKYRRMAN